jgi:hypothetical protein
MGSSKASIESGVRGVAILMRSRSVSGWGRESAATGARITEDEYTAWLRDNTRRR